MKRKKTEHRERVFQAGNHLVCYTTERHVNQGVKVINPKEKKIVQQTPETRVEVSAECDRCQRRVEMVFQDDKQELSLGRRYILGEFISSACVGPKGLSS